MATEHFALTLPSGTLHVERTGPADAEQVAICVHGLTANVRSWDGLRDDLAAAGVTCVALDLRGRGRSDITRAGSYGLASHAEDVLALADHLGLERWHQVGWSMGALISLGLAERAGERLRSVTLLDAVGGMDPAALEGVRTASARLDAVVPDEAAYLAAVRASGVFEPWGPFWEGYFRWELHHVDGGVTPRTDRAACLEDLEGATEDFTQLWPHLTAPTLLVWAAAPLPGGLLVPEAVRDRFLAEVPGATLHAVQRNHYALMTDQAVRDAIVAHVTSAAAASGAAS